MKFGQLTVSGVQEVGKLSALDRRARFDRDHRLSVRRQCALLGLMRSGISRQPPQKTTMNPALMCPIYAPFTAWPLSGSLRTLRIRPVAPVTPVTTGDGPLTTRTIADDLSAACKCAVKGWGGLADGDHHRG